MLCDRRNGLSSSRTLHFSSSSRAQAPKLRYTYKRYRGGGAVHDLILQPCHAALIPLKGVDTIIKLLKDLDGRDKSIKIVQYLLKILIHHDRVQKRRWASTVSSCSMTRKILRLGLGLGPARQLLYERERLSFRESCLLVNEMGNTIADDLVCLYKLRLVPASVGRQSEIIANYCWLVGIANTLADTFVALQELKTMEKIDHEKIFMTRVSIAKLSMDGIFCLSDIWQPPYADGVMAWAGFFSGSLATYKLWKKVSLVV